MDSNEDVGLVFVFDCDGRVRGYRTLDWADSAGEIREWWEGSEDDPALFALDGRPITVEGGDFVIHKVAEPFQLKARLERAASFEPFRSSTDNIVAIANELLDREHECRWPKRPRWLSRRLHGPGPRRVGD